MSWREAERVTVGPQGTDENQSVTVTKEVKQEGAYGLPEYRVGAIHALAQKSHTRKRVFKGEMAHMDAERFYSDMVSKVVYA